jgi:uncharacterized membrane protein YeaQ/YmgE (transglycosylase-associated protein family)
MTLEMIVVAIIVGLAVGALAGFVRKGGDYGLIGDVLLGLGGSFVGGWIFRTLGPASGGGWFTMVAVAFVGAAVIIGAHRIAERMLWPVRT